MSGRLVRRHQILLHLQQSVGDTVRVDRVLAGTDRALQCRNASVWTSGASCTRLRQGEHAARAESVILTLSTLGCGALVAVLTAMLARICSIGLPLPLAPRELLSSPLIRSATRLSL